MLSRTESHHSGRSRRFRCGGPSPVIVVACTRITGSCGFTPATSGSFAHSSSTVAGGAVAPSKIQLAVLLRRGAALAAGHRPCGECRHPSYVAYRDAWAAAWPVGGVPTAREMNRQLHGERLVRGTHRRRLHSMPWWELPDGALRLGSRGDSSIGPRNRVGGVDPRGLSRPIVEADARRGHRHHTAIVFGGTPGWLRGPNRCFGIFLTIVSPGVAASP